MTTACWCHCALLVLLLASTAEARAIRQAVQHPTEQAAAAPVAVEPLALTANVATPPAGSALAMYPPELDPAAKIGHAPMLQPTKSVRMPVLADDGLTPVTSPDGTAHLKDVHLTLDHYTPITAAASAAPAPAPAAAAAAPRAAQHKPLARPRPSPRPSPSPSPPPGVEPCSPQGNFVCQNIAYHGGAIMNTGLKLFPIFYGDWTPTQQSIMFNFLSGLGGSAWMNISALYSDKFNGFYPNTPGLFNSTAPQAFTNVTIGTYGLTTSLADSDIFTLVQQSILTGAAPLSSNIIYLVLTGPSVTATSGFCTQYCGWHTQGTVSSTAVRYAFIGNAATRCPASCIASAVSAAPPNGDKGIDGMASVVAHEVTEALSDPDVKNGWFDSRGNENADICAWTFGNTYTAANGGAYNVVDFYGNIWYIQQNLNPRTGSCVLAA